MPAFNEAKVEVEYLRVVRDEHLWQKRPEDLESIVKVMPCQNSIIALIQLHAF